MELSALADDELLEVLQYLTVDELLLCRDVCRRWQTFALDPSIWRTRTLDVCDEGSSSGTPLDVLQRARSVLRLAPCLRQLKVSADSVCSDVWDLAFGTTRCAAIELIVYFHMEKSHLVALMLARQASLGRLKRVSLETFRPKYLYLDIPELGGNHGLGALLDQLVDTSGLETLSLSIYFPSKTTIMAPCQAEVPAASLREFKFDVIYNRDVKMHLGQAPHVQVLLEGHASTLEVVHINDAIGDEHYAASLPTSMPRLRELGCGVERVVDLTVPYPLLKTLHLTLCCPWLALAGSRRIASWRRAYRKAGLFLRTAVTYLDELKIYLCPKGVLFNLAYCFGASPAALSRLHLEVDVDEVHPPQLRHLAGVLPQLPHLTHLSSFHPTDALLDAMDGPAVPELLVLTVGIYEGCARAWVRSEKVRRVMCSHPRLHIVLETIWHDDDDCCTYCRKHFKKIWLCFTHPKGSHCDVVNHDDHHQIRIRLPSL